MRNIDIPWFFPRGAPPLLLLTSAPVLRGGSRRPPTSTVSQRARRGRRGSIESSPIGINEQVPSYDLTRLADGVTFVDVDTRLDSSELPSPMAIASFDE